MSNIFDRAYLTSLQQNMRVVADGSFSATAADLRYGLISNTLTDQAATVQLIIPIDADTIDHGVDEGEISYSKLEELNLVYDYQHSTKGLEVSRARFTDGDWAAARCADWARNMGINAAYLPERLTWDVVKNGLTLTTQVDSLPLFSKVHRNNPRDSSRLTYSNYFSGTAASGSPNNPGALRIDSGVSVDVAFQNVGKALAGIQQIKCADGVTPKRLRAKTLFVDPTNEARARQLTNAAFLNTNDVSAVVQNQGLTVEVIPELTSGSTFYIGCQEIAGSQLGAVVYWEREPFSIKYLDNMSDAQLDAADVLQWHGRGRESAFPGIPYKLIRVDAT